MIDHQEYYLRWQIPTTDIDNHQPCEADIKVNDYQTDDNQEPIWELPLEELLQHLYFIFQIYYVYLITVKIQFQISIFMIDYTIYYYLIRYYTITYCLYCKFASMLDTHQLTNLLSPINSYNKTWKALSGKIYINNTHNLNRKYSPHSYLSEDIINKLFFQKKSSTKNIKNNYKNKEAKKIELNLNFFKGVQRNDKYLSGLTNFTDKQPFQSKIKNEQGDSNEVDLTKKFKQKFLVGKIIGQGAYATVRVAISKSDEKKVAIKVYDKNKIQELQRKKSILRQIIILSLINHKNVIKIIDAIETNNHMNIVMDYIKGISLRQHLQNTLQKKINQRECRIIIKGLAQALEHLQSLNVAHRDIKLQNVILDCYLNPKLIDFGFSTCIQPDQKIKMYCGTPSYMAPEIIQKKQYNGMQSDIWALGVLFFTIFTGFFPFKASTDEQLHRKIIGIEYPKQYFLQYKQVGDLISMMLKYNSNQRITAKEILNHPWIRNEKTQSFTKMNKNKQYKQNKKKRVNTTISSFKQKSVYQSKVLRNLNIFQNKQKQTMRSEIKKLKECLHKTKQMKLQESFQKGSDQNKLYLKKQKDHQRTQKNPKLFTIQKNKKSKTKI